MQRLIKFILYPLFYFFIFYLIEHFFSLIIGVSLTAEYPKNYFPLIHACKLDSSYHRICSPNLLFVFISLIFFIISYYLYVSLVFKKYKSFLLSTLILCFVVIGTSFIEVFLVIASGYLFNIYNDMILLR